MEPDSFASRKKKLKETSEAYKEAIETQVRDGYKVTERIGKAILVTGVILFTGYVIFQWLSSNGKKK